MDGISNYLSANWLGLVFLAAAIIIVALILVRYGQAIRVFVNEAKVELQKASWPWEPKERGMKKYKELTDSTLIVVIAMLLLSGYVAFWDFVMVNIVGALTR
jgi:preprotein translocase subunit SecE